MSNLFVTIYNYLRNHRALMWSFVALLTAAMGICAINIRYEEDINNFFPESKQSVSRILSSLEYSNRLVVFISSTGDIDQYDLLDCADSLAHRLSSNSDFSDNADITLRIEDHRVDAITDFIYSNLPILLNQSDYQRLDTLDIAQKMRDNYTLLTSSIGGYISEHIYRDPLGIGAERLRDLESMGSGYSYNMLDGYILSEDSRTLMFYIDPKVDSDHSAIVTAIESTLEDFNSNSLTIEYFGAPAVAYYNALQIKRDSMITLNIAILIVALFILYAFRSKRNILLLLAPVLFGVLFSLSMVYLIQGTISLIAVGSGSIIFGLAFSYAIHFISHLDHSSDVQSVIKELVFPLTVGSITTIGAFAGLLFTSSGLLQDFGLFSSFALIGTTLFTLIFLPQMVKVNRAKRVDSKLLKGTYEIVGRSHEKSKFLIGFILLATTISVIFFNDVRFDSNMMNLNYMPDHLSQSEGRLNSFIKKGEGESNVMVIASADSLEQTIEAYQDLANSLQLLEADSSIISFSTIAPYVISDSLQQLRIERWESYWNRERVDKLLTSIAKSESELGFESGAFSKFRELLSSDYSTIDYGVGSPFVELFPEWVNPIDSSVMFISGIVIENSKKEDVYRELTSQRGIIAADRTYFASMMSEDVSENFYLVLYISGILIFSVLLLCYGRLELTLIAFSPMLIGWVIIIGLMSLFSIDFNIVTIILSAFIFGIGDDFSIFVLDGLLSNYRNGSKVLSYHKRAIFISALSLIVGMGALIFAKHPAMYSLGLISLIGMAVVVLVSYTIQPLLFKLFISKQTAKGGFPFTIKSLLVSIWAFALFLAGCLIVQLVIVILRPFIWSRDRREASIHSITRWFTHWFMVVMPTARRVKINEQGEDFSKPALIIANHQSFIDILLLLGLSSKFVMVTNSWVWNSPFFGKIVRFLGFFHTADGYENSIDKLQQKVDRGYSIVIFPEGTRSGDNEIKRFHKGAFYMAEKLKLDIVPIVIYGTGLVSSKSQPFYIKHGTLVTKILPRISVDSLEYGSGYRERSKAIRKYFCDQYNIVLDEYSRASNGYYRDAIIKNYIYKGAVLEWYMRIKLRLEKWYDTYDRLLPRSGHIVDIGCGYGAMSYMLQMMAKDREITAIDYDSEKIEVATNCFAKSSKIEFYSADIRSYSIPAADGYIISDVLHYLDKESQHRVIEACILGLRQGGVILIREGDTSKSSSHKNTEATERWSTKYIKFNKTDGDLNFISKDEVFDIANKHRMDIEIIESSSKTSNTLYRIRHKDGE